MALGGGYYTEQNKFLPGAYHKTRSEQSNEVELSERGRVAVAMGLDWQPDGLIRMQNTSTANYTDATPQWTRDCKKIFGYGHNAPQLLNIREVFRHAKEVLIFPLGKATKASNTFGTAKNGGVRGNDLSTVITANVDEPTLFDVMTYLDLELVDTQTVASVGDLVDTNWVAWKPGAVLAETASTPFTGGANATATGADHLAALTEFEPLRFEQLICPAADEEVIKTYVEWTTRMVNDFGHWHGLVVYDYLVDNMRVTTVKNTVEGGTGPELIYYTGGELAGCPASAATDNNPYLGEYSILEATKDQVELESLMRQGYYIYHAVEGTMRVLADNNSFVSYSKDHGEEYGRNQTLRALDQVATDSDKIFINEFLGVAGTADFDLSNFRIRMIELRNALQATRVIKDFRSQDIEVTAGDQIDSYYIRELIRPNLCVRKLYTETIVGTKQRSE